MTGVYTRVTAEIIAALERGVVPWHQPWTTTNAPPMNLVSRRPYRGINAVTTWAAQYASPWWLSWLQIQHLGGHVRRGEKGSVIVFFKRRHSRGQGLATEEGFDQQEPHDTYRFPFIVRYTHVWNVEQTEGLDAQVPVVARPSIAADAQAEAVLAAWAQRPGMQYGSSRACYNPSRDLVQMPDRQWFESTSAYYGVLWHECVHATGHVSRLGRFTPDTRCAPFGSVDYSFEELIAELGAAFLCGHLGLASRIESHAAYIEHWLTVFRANTRVLVQAATQAQRAVDLILGVTGTSPDAVS